MALKLRGGQTKSEFKAAQLKRSNPITPNNSITLPTTPSQQPSEPSTPMIGQSFERMGLGSIGGLGGRMGQLEQASMRLSQAASDRRIKEAEREYGLKQGLAQTESDIGLRAKSLMEGYSSPQQMQSDIASQRSERERKEREAEDIAKRLSQGQYQVGGRWFFGTGQR